MIITINHANELKKKKNCEFSFFLYSRHKNYVVFIVDFINTRKISLFRGLKLKTQNTKQTTGQLELKLNS